MSANQEDRFLRYQALLKRTLAFMDRRHRNLVKDHQRLLAKYRALRDKERNP